MTLSHAGVANTLRSSFVCGWENIEGKKGSGRSHKHECKNPAADVNNGSGFRNVQLFVLTPDGRVVHCLPGFWKPDMLLKELEFARSLVKVWNDPKATSGAKIRKFTELHLEHVNRHTAREAVESDLPHFDKFRESVKRTTDTKRTGGTIKMADQIIHERMAERPFVAYEEFDTAAFTDVGQEFYDAHNDG